MVFECKRCGYNTTKRVDLIKHLNRKKICNPILSNISAEQLIMEIPEPKIITKETDITYNCKYCNRKFNSSGNRSKHHKKCTQNPNKQLEEQIDILRSEMQQQIKQLQDEVNLLKQQLISSDIPISTTPVASSVITGDHNNITNNIDQSHNNTINCYNNSSYDHMTLQRILPLLSNLVHKTEGVPFLVKDIHFNPAIPSNNNIQFIDNERSKIYDSDKWDEIETEKLFMKMSSDMLDLVRNSIKNEEYELIKDNYNRDKLKENIGFIKDIVNRPEIIDPHTKEAMAKHLCNISKKYYENVEPKSDNVLDLI